MSESLNLLLALGGFAGVAFLGIFTVTYLRLRNRTQKNKKLSKKKKREMMKQ